MVTYMKETKRLQLIDVLIVLCTVLIIAVAVFRGALTGYIATGKNLTQYTVAFASDDIPNTYVGLIKSGEEVAWVEKGHVIGTINAVNTPKPAEIVTVNHEGTLTTTVSDTASTVSGTISVSAADMDGCFISGTDFIGAGMRMTLKTGSAVFTVTVLSVTKR